jgi:hypothetical protein
MRALCRTMRSRTRPSLAVLSRSDRQEARERRRHRLRVRTSLIAAICMGTPVAFRILMGSPSPQTVVTDGCVRATTARAEVGACRAPPTDHLLARGRAGAKPTPPSTAQALPSTTSRTAVASVAARATPAASGGPVVGVAPGPRQAAAPATAHVSRKPEQRANAAGRPADPSARHANDAESRLPHVRSETGPASATGAGTAAHLPYVPPPASPTTAGDARHEGLQDPRRSSPTSSPHLPADPAGALAEPFTTPTPSIEWTGPQPTLAPPFSS